MGAGSEDVTPRRTECPWAAPAPRLLLHAPAFGFGHPQFGIGSAWDPLVGIASVRGGGRERSSTSGLAKGTVIFALGRRSCALLGSWSAESLLKAARSLCCDPGCGHEHLTVVGNDED
ncbi:hypothetical protein COCON_G00073710 [Conger conger]|uniref:Uncharacterized protein n=1 Tax=Conger conger TaxID=82655 RepID=A0A9Q1DNE2_CONCO|nr:hypothetical protein COCON_G00073710 [Conger conger]